MEGPITHGDGTLGTILQQGAIQPPAGLWPTCVGHLTGERGNLPRKDVHVLQATYQAWCCLCARGQKEAGVPRVHGAALGCTLQSTLVQGPILGLRSRDPLGPVALSAQRCGDPPTRATPGGPARPSAPNTVFRTHLVSTEEMNDLHQHPFQKAEHTKIAWLQSLGWGWGWEGESRGPLLWKSGGLPWEVSPLPLGV